LNKYHIEIERLTKILDDQGVMIKNLNGEKVDLLNRLDELNFEVKSYSDKLKNRENSLNQAQRQIEESNKNVSNLELHNSELEENLLRTKNDLNNINNAYAKERANRVEAEKNNEKLEGILAGKVAEIKRLTIELEKHRDLNEKLNQEKSKLLGESERFRNHIYVLTEQNQNVSKIYFIANS
jgi:chromosome segregation ATPase